MPIAPASNEDTMLEGFETRRIETSGATINVKTAGSGPPVLLLHGYPQTHLIWHEIAPRLTQTHTVIMTDLRGYGDSEKPASDQAHAAYSKRAMAADQVEVMAALGFDRFAVVGHDRGARVSHRMARDHAGRVEKLAVLDIAPTAFMYQATDMAFATAYYHWFFLIQPYDLPERMIGADPAFYLDWILDNWCKTPGAIRPGARDEYLRCFADPVAIHASCEDYRAAATVDLEHDAADSGSKIAMPLLALWGRDGVVARSYDVLATWREVAENVSGHAVPGGHFVPEEAPAETLAALDDFL